MIQIIFGKRDKSQREMPLPKLEDNWRHDNYEANVKEGVRQLQQGHPVKIYDDGRGFELACDIKRQFILQYSQQLAETIKIKDTGTVIIVDKSFKQ